MAKGSSFEIKIGMFNVIRPLRYLKLNVMPLVLADNPRVIPVILLSVLEVEAANSALVMPSRTMSFPSTFFVNLEANGTKS